MKVKVRIALIVNSAGRWTANGWGGPAGAEDEEQALGVALDMLDSSLPEVRHWVELEVDAPTVASVHAEVERTPAPLSDALLDNLANQMPGGLGGFCKEWGYRQFAREIEKAHGIEQS